MVALWAYINQSIFDGITLLSTTKEITTFRKSPSAASDGYFAPSRACPVTNLYFICS